MKTTITAEQIKQVEQALRKIHVFPFGCQSSDPKYNAQRNLNGKTHYVEDDTLKWHHGRVNTSGTLCGGLLFFIGTTDALDMHNTRRGHRFVVFDLFGTAIYRPDLESFKSTSAAARKDFEAAEFDVLAHYRQAFADMMKRKTDEVAEMQSALDAINADESEAIAA